MENLDDTDRKILRLLQRDCSLRLAEIAREVGLSPSPCWRRIRSMKEAGVIQGEVALVDPRALGLRLTVHASVTLTHHGEETVEAFERAVQTMPEVMECVAVTGDRDYMLRIAVEDVESYDRFLTQRLLHLPMVGGVNSRFALRRVKYSTALPV
jgi:DNA-binding Lrp family transcriptional regulator